MVVGYYCEPNQRGGCTTHGAVEVLLGEGNGTLRPTMILPTPLPVASIAIADVNGGRTDLILASDSYSVMALYGDLVPSTTTLASSPNPSVVNQTVTLTATITPSVGKDQGGETVNFYDGATLIGSGTTYHGIATLTTTFSTAGRRKLKAQFPRNRAFTRSIGEMNQTVDAAEN